MATPQIPMLMKRPQPHRVRAHRRVQTTITVSSCHNYHGVPVFVSHKCSSCFLFVQQQSVMANPKPSNRNMKVCPLLLFTIMSQRKDLPTSYSLLFSRHIEKIRVGRDYQAVCPQLVPELDRRPELMNERALLVWSPTKEIPDMKCECDELTSIFWSILYMYDIEFLIRSGGIHFGGQREIRL